MSSNDTMMKPGNLINEWKMWENLPKPVVSFNESHEQILGAMIDQQAKAVCGAWACIQDFIRIIDEIR